MDEVVAKKSVSTSRMWKNLMIKENMILQKSRLKWGRKGDSNSRFFHSFMKDRRRRNFIGSITSEGGMLETVRELKVDARRFFCNVC